MSTCDDQSFQQWRDALTTGALPTPTRERWQPLRAGVVNLWEFEAVEYWYANGWAQLMGRNETGKSSLMALTTLIPWLGDTASDKIDTLGRSGKQFAYYVRPSGDSDRRDAEASFYHGWLWVEYGRVCAGVEEFFTTLLYAAARTGSANTRLTWCTSAGSRVRDTLRLTDGRAVCAAKDVTAAGFEAHPTATAYRQRLAAHLLGGSLAQLDGIGKLLKVTRQPKLGAQLKPEFVTGHLRDSLPELSRTEVNELAQGWDQLDQLRADLDRARDATSAVARFQRDGWRPWAAAQLRLRADEVAARQTDFDGVTREEREAKEELKDSQRAKAELDQARRESETRVAADEARVTALHESSAYQDAYQRVNRLEQAEQGVEAARNDVVRASQDTQKAEQRAAAARTDLTRRADEHDAAVEQLTRLDSDLRSVAGDAGLRCPVPLDADLVQQATVERSDQVRQVDSLRRTAAEADRQAHSHELTADALQRTADATATLAHQAWQAADDERGRVAESLTDWAPTEVTGSVPTWIDALPLTPDSTGPRLIDLIRRDFYQPRHGELTGSLAAARIHKQGLVGRLTELQGQIDQLEETKMAVPAGPLLWRRRDRTRAPGAPGAPLWKLVNPTGRATASDLAHVEAALAASGLLDAWVQPGEPDGLDTYVSASTRVPDQHSRSLAELLEVAEDAGDGYARIRALLQAVTLHDADESLPAAGVAIAVDGRWRVADLTGRAAPLHPQAEWLGEAAREAQRQRRLAELRAELADLHTRVEKAQDAEEGWSKALQELAELFEKAPHDDGLHQALAHCRARDESAQAQRQEADRALATARELRSTSDSRSAELRQAARTHQLPVTEDKLRQIQHAVEQTRTRLASWRHGAENVQRSEQLVHQATDEATRRDKDAAEQQTALATAEDAHRVAQARAEALRASIDADDRQLLDELDRLRQAVRTGRAERERLDRQRTEVAYRLGVAENKLAEVAKRREAATEERTHAHRAWRELIDLDLAAGLPVDLPEPASAAVEHVRTQATAVRRALRPRGWSEGSQRDTTATNTAIVERLRRALDQAAREIRSLLEQSGRSLQVLPQEPVPAVEVMVNSNGMTLPLAEAGEHLQGVCTELEGQYSDSVRETLDRLLGSTFLEHMRERIGQAIALIDDINTVLREHPTGTNGTTLRIRLEPGRNAGILAAVSGPGLIDPEVTAHVRDFLRQKVDEAKRAAANEGQSDWRDSLADHLDYRNWYEVALESRVADGRWGPLTTRRYAELSGGARAVMLMLPLVAALAAQYQHLPQAPRPLWLDEAFDGLDLTNRSMVMRLLQRFDLDVLLAGPGRLVNVEAVPAAAIYQVVRAPAPEPGADLVAELWVGRTLHAIDLPLSWLDGPAAAPADQDSLL